MDSKESSLKIADGIGYKSRNNLGSKVYAFRYMCGLILQLNEKFKFHTAFSINIF